MCDDPEIIAGYQWRLVMDLGSIFPPCQPWEPGCPFDVSLLIAELPTHPELRPPLASLGVQTAENPAEIKACLDVIATSNNGYEGAKLECVDDRHCWYRLVFDYDE